MIYLTYYISFSDFDLDHGKKRRKSPNRLTRFHIFFIFRRWLLNDGSIEALGKAITLFEGTNDASLRVYNTFLSFKNGLFE